MNSRRHFLRKLIVSSPLLIGARALSQDTPAAEPAPSEEAKQPDADIVPLDDPIAKMLGYVEKVEDVDKTKYPMYKEGQTCANCLHYTGKADEKYGPCALLQKRLVTAEGWCMTWAAKLPATPAE